MVLQSPRRPIPLDSRALASRLGCSYQTFIRLLKDFTEEPRFDVIRDKAKPGGVKTIARGRAPFFIQDFGIVLFQGRRKHRLGSPCAHPQWYVVSRFALSTIGGRPRPSLRKKTRQDWSQYRRYIKKLLFGQRNSQKSTAIDKHHATNSVIGYEGGAAARPPPREKANRPAYRRFRELAHFLNERYNREEDAFPVDLWGWCVNRLAEWHDQDRIFWCLLHANANIPEGSRKPKNVPAWICATAKLHLDRDGFTPRQRYDSGRRRSAPTFKVENSEAGGYEIITDED